MVDLEALRNRPDEVLVEKAVSGALALPPVRVRHLAVARSRETEEPPPAPGRRFDSNAGLSALVVIQNELHRLAEHMSLAGPVTRRQRGRQSTAALAELRRRAHD